MEQVMPQPIGSDDAIAMPTEPMKGLKKKQTGKKSGKALPQQNKPPTTTTAQPKDGQAEQSSHRVTLHKHLRKTRFCMYHLQGACQFGAECSFAHSLAEMHQTPDLSKTQLCKAYAQGGCNNPDCMFAHGDDELRSTDMFFKKTLCIWHEKGKCRNAERCRFAHGVKELRARQAAEPEMNMPAPQSNGKVRKNAMNTRDALGMPAPPPGSRLDPMKISPENFMGLDNVAAAAASLQLQLPPQAAGLQLPPQAVSNAGNGGKNGNDLNSELSQLCQSIAILTAQCNNIQKRMELEAEFNNIQRRAESLGMNPLSLLGHGMPGSALGPSYQGYPGQGSSDLQQGPYPPGLGSLATPLGDASNPSVALMLQAMKNQYHY